MHGQRASNLDGYLRHYGSTLNEDALTGLARIVTAAVAGAEMKNVVELLTETLTQRKGVEEDG